MRFRKLIIVLALLCVAWTGIKGVQQRHSPSPDNLTPDQVRTLASTVNATDIVMYSTSECPYCAQARNWFNQYGFAFTECNMSVDKQCEREFEKYGATGTPFLIVRGHHMNDGFDSDEFLAAITKT